MAPWNFHPSMITTLCINHLENTGSTELYISKCRISYKKIIIFIKITIGLIIKTINYWEIQFHMAGKSFPKLNFYHRQQI